MGEKGFSVYIGSLGKMATSMDGAADSFRQVSDVANGPARVATDALGFIGRACQWPEKYKSACDNIHKKAQQAAKSFDKAAGELVEIEKEYIARDDYYANKFNLKADNNYPKLPNFDNPKPPPTQPRQPPQQPAQPKLPTQI